MATGRGPRRAVGRPRGRQPGHRRAAPSASPPHRGPRPRRARARCRGVVGRSAGAGAGDPALPRRQREVVVLRYLADLSEAATAQELGTSVGSVKQHAHRGLAALRGAWTETDRYADADPRPVRSPTLERPDARPPRSPRLPRRPAGFTPDDDFRAAVLRRGRRRRRRHRLAGATGAGVVLVVALAGAALAGSTTSSIGSTGSRSPPCARRNRLRRRPTRCCSSGRTAAPAPATRRTRPSTGRAPTRSSWPGSGPTTG